MAVPAPITSPEDPTGTQAREDVPPLVALALRLEEDERLDPAVDALRPVADALLADETRRDLLLGRSMGHSLHPLLTDVPIGTWASAILLDLLGGPSARPAARRLVGIGILAAVPTALSGLADWGHTQQRDRRVGVVHAAGNTVGLLMFSASWISRGRGHHLKGVTLSLLGGAALGVSGFLGAHLSLARNVSARDEAFADSLPVADAAVTEDKLTD